MVSRDDQPNDALTTAVCPVCGKRVRIVNPRGGDGSARLFTMHPPRPYGRPCTGSRQEVQL